ncbi:MAG: hypothetical protein OHK0021_14290 [Bryobacter sp.]
MDAFDELWQRHEQLTAKFAKLLHDDAGQVLTAIALRLSCLDTSLASAGEVKELQKILDDLLERFREAQASLGAAMVAKRGLQAGLSQLARHQGGLRVSGTPGNLWQGRAALASFRIVEHLQPVEVAFAGQQILLKGARPPDAYAEELARHGACTLQSTKQGITISIRDGDTNTHR